MCKMSERFFLYFILCLHFTVVFITLVCATDSTDEVQIEVIFLPENCTQKARKGDLLNAHYDGYLAKDGSQFYCSRSAKDGQPHWFVHGVGEVIKGLDIGLKEMCPGEKRKITVPPSLAFGEKGKDPVPPNATLIFKVELLHVRRGPRSMEAFNEMDHNNDRTLTKEEVKEHLKMEAKKLNVQKDESYFDAVVSDVFRRNDEDADGTLTIKEYNVYEHDEL
ncbi:peptidyl-prolyl cis-trans isomerase FKBP7 [Tachysurus fulvidraco]|uniref:peptidyl-prolyl cis-trans isomerase FKBP7 n=1 Tax=Tachysurus fulvidraco TaxID=1234273 RepID=UPI000F5096CF|nr:peptidyl-prolyl cis-trans isomerase FKBP7 [Tachysurus fulvidraco]